MKIGVRKPSIKKSFKARRTGRAKRAVKQAVIPGYGKKGSGWIKNPKKAAYNKVYNKTTVSATKILTGGSSKKINKSSNGSHFESYNHNVKINDFDTKFNSISYVSLINEYNKIKTCKVGFSWTSLFFMYLVPLFRLDFKNFFIQLLIYMISGLINPNLVLLIYIVIPFIYNKVYIKDLVKKGYKPCSDKDTILVNKILNTSTTVQRDENKDESIEDLINETSTTDDFDNYPNIFDNYPNIIENKQNISSYSLNSTNYNDLIYQKYELYMQIQNMNYGIEENIKEYKSVLNKLLELFPDDYTYIELLNEINLKEEYLINFSKLQTCINILNNPRDLSAYLFNKYLTEIKDIYLPKLKESEEKNIKVYTISSFELGLYIKEKTKQYQRKLKREEKEYRDNRNYVVFDLETTGLSAITHEILEIGDVKVIDGEVVDNFEMLVKPAKKITKRITEITGITNEMVEDKPPIEDVLPQFIEFIGKLPLVAHNAEFDYGFLCENYKRIYGKEFRRKKSCTMKMYRKWYKEEWGEKAPSAKLGDVIFDLLDRDEYSSYRSNSHRGLNDAEFTQKVYEKLI